MHRTVKTHPHHLGDAARIVAVRLVDLRLQNRSRSNFGNSIAAYSALTSAPSNLPAMFEAREFVEDGGLMAYGPNLAEMTRRSASLIKGANPGELPIEQPTTFELIKPADLPVLQPTKFQFVLNRKTANALDLTIPANVLAIVDEVIE